MIAITDATGQLGRLVVEQISKKISPTRIIALVRDPAKGADLGVSVRKADDGQPATLDAALAGIDDQHPTGRARASCRARDITCSAARTWSSENPNSTMPCSSSSGGQSRNETGLPSTTANFAA